MVAETIQIRTIWVALEKSDLLEITTFQNHILISPDKMLSQSVCLILRYVMQN